MSASSFLSGRVIFRTLPVFDGPPPATATAPGPKRLRLAQGELAQFMADGDEARYIAWLEMAGERIRGNHYHHRKQERVYLASGELELTCMDISTGERAVLRMSAGDHVSIAPGVAHAVRVIRPGQAVEYSPEPFDPTDTVRHEVVGPGPAAGPGDSGISGRG